MQNKSNVHAIILASGLSSRMGQPKLMLPWQGMTIIEHVLTKIAMMPLNSITIILPEQNEALKEIVSFFPCEVVYNPTPGLGIGYSLALASKNLPYASEAAIILLGDQPEVESIHIQHIVAIFNQMYLERNACPQTIIQMKYGNGQSGHPILFSHHFFKALQSLSGDRGGRAIIENNKRFLVHCSTNHDYPQDIDTPDDYRRLIEHKGDSIDDRK